MPNENDPVDPKFFEIMGGLINDDVAGPSSWAKMTPAFVSSLAEIARQTDLSRMVMAESVLLMALKSIALGAEDPAGIAVAAMYAVIPPGHEWFIKVLLSDVAQADE